MNDEISSPEASDISYRRLTNM